MCGSLIYEHPRHAEAGHFAERMGTVRSAMRVLGERGEPS